MIPGSLSTPCMLVRWHRPRCLEGSVEKRGGVSALNRPPSFARCTSLMESDGAVKLLVGLYCLPLFCSGISSNNDIPGSLQYYIVIATHDSEIRSCFGAPCSRIL